MASLLPFKPSPWAVRLGKQAMRASIGRAAGLVLPRPRCFFIVTAGRSGSNLLVSLLGQHDAISMHTELFGEYLLNDARLGAAVRRLGAPAYLRGELRRVAGERLIGHKILYYQIEDAHAARYGLSGMETVRESLFADPDYRFIHLKRTDRLAWLTSKHLAERNRNWAAGTYRTPSVRIDPQAALCDLSEAAAHETRYDALLPRERTLDLTYEALAGETDSVMGDVFDFLGVTPVAVQKKLRKQNRSAPQDAIENYAELKAALAGSPHADIFAG